MADDNTERIYTLEREIASLPQGSIGKKTVRGNIYHYHRYSQNGSRVEKYIDPEMLPALAEQIEKRRKLEEELKALKKSVHGKGRKKAHETLTSVRVGKQLSAWAGCAEKYRRRECYAALHDYVFGEHSDRVFILYGLRRTGKTTMLRQTVLDMTEEQRGMTAFIQVTSSDNIRSVNRELRNLEEKGYRYVFIDEVTLMDDFIGNAALFSDIYASSGMKIVLSGTDSLGFLISSHDQLYDRTIMLHTTFIPYREFENVLGIRGIENYIRYGGTMSMGGIHYNAYSTFATKESADEYVDSSIALNIQHSLKNYQDGSHFRLFFELYRKGELTSAINRVVEDLNHAFTKEVLTRTFTSSTLSLTANNLLRDRASRPDLKDNIDWNGVISSMKAALDILEKEEQTVEVDDDTALQIREYLVMLDLVKDIDVIHFPDISRKGRKTVLTQCGLRFAQTEAFVSAILGDSRFNDMSYDDRERVISRLDSTIEGRMMEDIVLLETAAAFPEKKVFQLQFSVGEFDMVVFSPGSGTCEIYEVKYSRGIYPEQYQHLKNEEKCRETEHRWGRITGKFVIYRGEDAEADGIRYINVEEYLKGLGRGSCGK